MKVKHFIYASACVVGLAACNNEEVVLNNNSLFDGKGELVELKEGFLLSVGKSGLEESRALGTDGKFLWMPTAPGASEVAEKIGLCWTGVNNLNPAAAPLAATGNMVYTNYEFNHAGWLYTGQTAPKYNVCDNTLANGEYLETAAGSPNATVTAGEYAATTAGKTLNFAKGVFNTQNSAIYSGEYIVYYPYSNEFFDSPIVASAPKAVTVDAAANKYDVMAKNSFNVGYVANFAGGQDTETFATNMLSAGAYIAFHNTSTTSAVTLKQVVLLAAGANDAFITKQELSAQAIKNANNVPNNMGTGLYLGAPKTTSKTVVANYDADVTVAANTAANSATGYVVLPVLPTTISDLKILLVDNNNKTAVVDCGNVAFESISKGKYSLQKNIDLKGIEFKKEYIATDAASLNSIITTLNGLTGADVPTAAKPISVRTIGDITLEGTGSGVKITTFGGKNYYSYIRFYGDKLIVPADQVLNAAEGITIENDIDVMHAGCCGTYPASLSLYAAKLTGDINNYGTITLGNGGVLNNTTTTLDGVTLNNLKGETTEKGIEIEYEGTILVKEKMTMLLAGDAAIVNEGKITTEGTGVKNNDGTITIKQGSTATIANEGVIENGGNINASNGLSNTTTDAIFVDKVGSQLSGYGLDNTANGHYICEVNDQTRYNTAITSAIRPTTLVRFIAGGTYYIKHGDVNNSKGSMVSFEVKCLNTEDIAFRGVDDVNTTTVDESTLASTVENILLTSAKAVKFRKPFAVEEILNMYATKLEVYSDLNIGAEWNLVNGATVVEEGVNINAINSACAMSVEKGVSVEFKNFGKSYFNNIANDGSIDIKVASGAAGVAHELWTKTYTTYSNGVWANNSYPLQY